MLSFIKKFFGSKPTVSPCPEAPYKVETPQTTVGAVPMSTQYQTAPETAAKKKPAAKKPAGEMKPAVKAKTVRAKKKAS
jgi:hypothetical protein